VLLASRDGPLEVPEPAVPLATAAETPMLTLPEPEPEPERTQASGAPQRRVSQSLMHTAYTATAQQLYFAAYRGDMTALRRCLDDGITVDLRKQPYGQTALHWAACGLQLPAVELLLGQGAEVNAACEGDGRRALHFATDWVLAEVLLRAGADCSAVDKEGRTPAQYHMRHGPSSNTFELGLLIEDWALTAAAAATVSAAAAQEAEAAYQEVLVGRATRLDKLEQPPPLMTPAADTPPDLSAAPDEQAESRDHLPEPPPAVEEGDGLG
jgi:ankyrin repeat protein